MSQKNSAKRVLMGVLGSIVICVIAFAAWFTYEIYTDSPPQFFPLDDAQAEYRITKSCPNGQGWTEQNVIGEAYCVEYRGDNVLMKEDYYNSKYFNITVGKSKVDLAPFLDKKVKKIEGKYTSSGQQCILNECINIGGPFVVLNINSLELAE